MNRFITILATLVITVAVFVGAAWALFTFTKDSIEESMALHIATQHILIEKRLDDLVSLIKENNIGLQEINIKLVQIQTDIRYLQKAR